MRCKGIRIETDRLQDQLTRMNSQVTALKATVINVEREKEKLSKYSGEVEALLGERQLKEESLRSQLDKKKVEFCEPDSDGAGL